MIAMKLIIFDWDDTFTTGGIEGYYQCYHKALVEVGLNLSQDEERRIIRQFWGRPHREVLTALVGERTDLFVDAVRLYNVHLLDGTFLNCLSLVPGALDVLEMLKNNYILTIASAGNPQVLKEQVFPHFQVPDVFAQILTSRELPDPSRGKPHADLVLQIMRDQNIEKADTLVVGDGGSDVLMAQAAGALPVVVLTGQLTRENAQDLGVVHILEDVTELPGLLETL